METFEKIIQECLVYTEGTTEILFLIEPNLMYIHDTITLQKIIDEYNKILDKYNTKGVKFVILLEMQNMKNKIDCTRIDGHIKGLSMLLDEALSVALKLLEIRINDSWILGFNQNRTDSYSYTDNIKFNNDIMLNYLFYINKITQSTKISALLYNIPCGLINKTENIEHTNTRCDYEDGSLLLLLGGTIQNQKDFYRENTWGDNLKFDKKNVTFDSKLQKCIKSNIRYILFGSEFDVGTTNNYSKNSAGRCMDHYYSTKLLK